MLDQLEGRWNIEVEPDSQIFNLEKYYKKQKQTFFEIVNEKGAVWGAIRI